MTRPSFFRYVLVNAALFLAAAAAGAFVSSTVAYAVADSGTLPGSPIGAVLGGTLLLFVMLVSLGLPVAIVTIALVWLIARRRVVARRWLMILAVGAGVLWLRIVIVRSVPSELPVRNIAAVSLLAPWILFGAVMRVPPLLLRRDIHSG